MNVQGPGGAVVSFPDGTDAQTVDRVMRQHFAQTSDGPTVAGPANPASAGGSAAPINPFTGRTEEPSVTVGGTVGNALGGFNEKVGSVLFAPTNGFNALADALLGSKPTPNSAQERWNATFNGPAPQNATERAVRRGGEFVAESLPLSAGVGMAAAGSRMAVDMGRVAAGKIGPSLANAGNVILDTIRGAPLATTAGDMYANLLSGVGAQRGRELAEGTGYEGAAEAAGAIAGGLAAPLTSWVSPTALAARGAAAGAKLATRALPEAADAEARAAERLAFANREGRFADPDVPAPAEPGWATRLQDMASEARARKAAGYVGRDLQRVMANPDAQTALAEADALRGEIPGFQPSIAKATGNQPLLNKQAQLEGQASGPDLLRVRDRYDANARAIGAYADDAVPPTAGAHPADGVAAALQRHVAEQYRDLDAQLDAARGQLRTMSDIPTVDRAAVGSGLRDLRAGARATAETEVARRRAAVDPEGEVRLPGTDLRNGIIQDLRAAGTDLTDPVIPPKVREILGNLEPTVRTTPESAILGPDGRPVRAASTTIEPATFDFNSLADAREQVGRQLRLLEQATAKTPANLQTADALRAVRTRIDQTIDTLAESQIPGIADRYREFRGFYRDEYAPRFSRGASKDIGARKDGDFRIPDEDVPKRWFGPNNITEARQFNQVYGENPAARQALTDYALDDLRQSATRNGVLDNGLVESFMRKNSRVLDEMPWMREALDARNPTGLHRQIADLEARRRVVADSEIARFTNERPEYAVDRLLSDHTVAARLKAELGGNADAERALARSVWERALGSGRTAGDPLFDADKMLAFVDKNFRSLAAVLSPEHMRSLKTVVAASRIEGQLPRPTGMPEQPKSLGDRVAGVAGISIPSFLSRLYAVDSGRTSRQFIGAELAMRAVNKLTSTELERAWKEALTNDKVAKMIAAVAEQRRGATPMQRDWLRSYLAVAPADMAGEGGQPEQP